jgi:hypothetical protein
VVLYALLARLVHDADHDVREYAELKEEPQLHPQVERARDA